VNLEKIWAQYRSALKAFLHSKISNATDVDDLLQDILIKTYQNLDKVKTQESIKSWIFQIANHTIIDFYRRNGKHNDLSQDDLWFEDDGPDIKQELSHCIEPFIQALPKESAQLLEAVDLNGVAQKEYAQTLGISYSTLKSRVQKSRTQLRQIFDGCCQMSLDSQGNLMDYNLKGDQCSKCD